MMIPPALYMDCLLSSFSPALAVNVCLLSVIGFCFVLFETECYCVALAALELTMYNRLFAICFVVVLVSAF